MNQKILRRILAFALCMILSLSLLPSFAFAAFTKTGNQVEDIVAYAMTRKGDKDERGKMCAGFVCTAAKKAGLDSTQINLKATLASPWPGDNQFGFLTKKGSPKYNCKAFTWKDVKSGAYTPQKGDLVFYGYFTDSTGGTAKLTLAQEAKKDYWHTHVGIVRANGFSDTTRDGKACYKLLTIDGGQSGSDGKSTWVKTRTRVLTKSSGYAGWSSNGHSVYLLEIIRPNYKTVEPPAPVVPTTPEEYLAACQKTNTYLRLSAVASTKHIMSLPCSGSTFDSSKSVRKTVQGEQLVATAIYKNTVGNYWYKVSASDGATGYLYGGDATAEGAPNDAISGNAKLSTTTPKYGKGLNITGTLKSKTLQIKTVKGVLTGSDGAAQKKTVTVGKTSFDIKPSAINSSLKFGKLKTGKGTLQLTVVLTGNDTDGKTLSTVEYTVKLPVVNFKVVK